MKGGDWHEDCGICARRQRQAAALMQWFELAPPKPGTHASHFGSWFDAIGNDPYAWQRAAAWSHAGQVTP